MGVSRVWEVLGEGVCTMATTFDLRVQGFSQDDLIQSAEPGPALSTAQGTRGPGFTLQPVGLLHPAAATPTRSGNAATAKLSGLLSC